MTEQTLIHIYELQERLKIQEDSFNRLLDGIQDIQNLAAESGNSRDYSFEYLKTDMRIIHKMTINLEEGRGAFEDEQL